MTWAIILRPFFALFLVGLVLLPARRWAQRLPDSRWKRFLLFRVSSAYDTWDDRPESHVSGPGKPWR